jgi:murein DD-endopeptidase MepM/ murein hydrolase activator NlpD
MPDNLNFTINGSVGRKSKGAANNSDDIETVQGILRIIAMAEQNPQLDPGAVDGTIDADEANDDTVKAIEAFQTRFMHSPDGGINVGKKSWQELMKALAGDDADTGPGAIIPPPGVADGGEFFFPFTEMPHESWADGMRAFGSSRDKGKRVHAGCDLWFPVGTTIHAITTGTVIAKPYLFYHSTDALEIDHGTFVARYGEIRQGSAASLKIGDQVTAGQPIANVGKLDNMKLSMLHLELYDKSAAGQLTVKNNQTKRNAAGLPFWRRRDLIDPTARLNQWKDNLPG